GMRLALERGEVEGICGLSFATLMAAQGDWIRQKKINFLAQTGLEKNPALPDVPLVSDYAKDAVDRMVFHMLDYREILGRPYVAPPGVPAARLAALRQAFDDTMRDPDFVAEATRLGMTLEPTDHWGVEKIIADAYATPKDVIEKTFDLIRGIGMGSGDDKENTDGKADQLRGAGLPAEGRHAGDPAHLGRVDRVRRGGAGGRRQHRPFSRAARRSGPDRARWLGSVG